MKAAGCIRALGRAHERLHADGPASRTEHHEVTPDGWKGSAAADVDDGQE